MKKSLLALAVLAASGAAMAQSSVTLYGVADTGVTYIGGNENVYGLTATGGNTNSRLGFRGVEDLGGGLKASFQLEAGINIDDGTGYLGKEGGKGLEFRRISKIGLEGGFGSVTLGRDLTASYMAVSRYDVFGDTGVGGSLAWNAGNTGYNARSENTLSYYTPTISGFRAGINYGFGEKTQARDSRYVGVGLAYDNGPISVGFGYDRNNNVALGKNAGGTSLASLEVDMKTWHLGGSYNFGVAKVAAFYKETKNVAVNTDDSEKFKTFGLGVTAPVGAGEVRASYNHHRLTGLGETLKADQFSLGYVHNLSKRTALYGTYAYIKNKDNNGDGMAMQLNGAMAGAGLKDSGAQHGFQVGVRHAF